jgi:undecaprenyl-diphosphatase
MTILQIILLALIQGVAELLPVSSSAHVIVAERVMGLDPAAPEMTFLLVMLHTGTMFAVLVYFWPRWKPLLFLPPATAGDASRFQFVKMVVLATVCTGVIGLGLKLFLEQVVLRRMLGESKEEIEQLFRNLPLIGTALFLVGVLIIAAGVHETKAETTTITTRSSVWIGIIQGLCLPFRGFSRSGATISVALFRGIERRRAEDFSFALAVVLTPAVIAWEFRRLLKAGNGDGSHDLIALLGPGLLGMAFSFVAGLLALRLLSWALEAGRWRWFGYYCLAAAAGVFVTWQFLV